MKYKRPFLVISGHGPPQRRIHQSSIAAARYYLKAHDYAHPVRIVDREAGTDEVWWTIEGGTKIRLMWRCLDCGALERPKNGRPRLRCHACRRRGAA